MSVVKQAPVVTETVGIIPFLGEQFRFVKTPGSPRKIKFFTENDIKLFFGVELELYPSFDYKVREQMAKHGINNASKLAESITDQFFHQDLMFRDLYRDHPNVEWPIAPISLLAYKNMRNQFTKFFEALQLCGFKCDRDGFVATGIHISIEADQLTPDELQKVLLIIYALEGTFIHLTNRKGNVDLRADIRSMTNKNSAEFTSVLSSVRHCMERKEGFSYLGIRYYTGSETLQFTHFGATLNFNEYLSYLQFVDSLIKYAKENTPPLAELYLDWLEVNKSDYLELTERLKSVTLQVKNQTQMMKILGEL